MDDYYAPEPTPSIEIPLTNNSDNIQTLNSAITYSTPCNCIPCILGIVCFIIGVSFFIFILISSLSSNHTEQIYFCVLPLLFVVIGILLISCFPLFNSITIDQFQQLVIVK